METITRKSLLYKSGIGVICINHAQGCSHGCLYPCYAYMMAKSYNKINNYTDWCQPKIVANSAELLTKELSKKRIKPETIYLCLSTDPFMFGFQEIIDLSLQLIAIINSFGIKCSILTKGKLPFELSNKNNYSEKNIYGISLISLNEEFRIKWEPGASAYSERISALKNLHDSGLQTLAHIEPYPTPNILKQNLVDILMAIEFVDCIYFSGWNYNDKAKLFPAYKQFYKEQSDIVKLFCKENNILYNLM
jgi:DNA repair photolyase